MTGAIRRGSVVWVDLNPTRGREQRGHQPALVVASRGYLDSVPDLVIVVPITSVDRGWHHHVAVTGERTGLDRASFAMTEQPRTISRERIVRRAGIVDADTLMAVDEWLRDFVGL